MKEYSNDFDHCWERFRVNVKARLMDRSKDAKLTLSLANLALKDAAAAWLDEYDILGGWLKKLKATRPMEAQELEKFLKYEMSFHEVEREKGIPELASYAVPIGGALAGAGISILRRSSVLVTAASMILPAAVLTPVMKTVKQNKEEEIDKKLIEGYLKQLELFKEKIYDML